MRVVVIGGGFSGLAAAARLSNEGSHHVTLIEARPDLGGAPPTAVDETTSDSIHQGAHLTLARHGATQALLARLGAAGALDFVELGAVRRLGRQTTARLSPDASFPRPLALLAGLARFGGLSVAERLLVLRVAKAVGVRSNGATVPAPGETFDAWLARLSQSAAARDVFWTPLVVALLGDVPARASAQTAVAALRREMFVDAGAPPLAVALPGGAPSLGAPALHFLQARGVSVRTGAFVEGVIVEPSAVGAVARGVALRGGERVDADVVIAAVAPRAALALVPEARRSERYFRGLSRLRASPVVSVHLWLDRAVAPRRFVGFLDAPIGWVLHETRPRAGTGPERSLLSLLIPAAEALADRSPDQLRALAVTALGRAIAGVGEARVEHARVLVDRDARVALSADPDSDRPTPRTPVDGFYLAAEYACAVPAAGVEAAVRAGEEAARLALFYEPPAPPKSFIPIGNLTRRRK